MKNNIIACIVLSVALLSSCSKDFDKMNTDPTQFVEATPEAAMQGSFKRLTDFMANNNCNRWWDVANAIQANTRYGMEDAGLWQLIYVNVLEPINQIKLTYGQDTNFVNRVQIARIWESYAYSVLVGNFGPVPQSQANNRDYLANVKYDPEDSVYSYILSTLKDAASKINVSRVQDRLAYDAIYGSGTSSLLSWKKFANSLRLKVALRCQKNLPQLAAQHISDVMANEASTIGSEAEMAKISYENVVNNENPYFIRYKRNTYTGDPPVLMDALFVYFRSYSDPRLDAYYDSVPTIADRYLLRDTLTSTADDSLRVLSAHL